jgi:4-hydroxybenzoate polyprenyltransferase
MVATQLLFLALSAEFSLDINSLSLILSTLFTAAGGYIINDYFDAAADELNKPDKVIIGKHIKRYIANRMYVMCLILALIFGYKALGDNVHWITVLNLILYLYSRILKRLPIIGNLAVSFASGMVIYICRFFYNYDEIGMFALETFFAMAFLVTVVREIVKDIEDREGDSQAGFKTFPIIAGDKRSKWTAGLFAIFAMAVSVIIALHLLENTDYYYWIIEVFILVLVFLALFVVRLARASEKVHYSQLSKFLKLIMVLGMLTAIFYL